MSKEPQPRVIPPPQDVAELGPLVVVDGDCAYFKDGRKSRMAFALPGEVDGPTYQRAMDIGMRRSGTVIYRPLCEGCRKCQPLRIPVEDFGPSRSQRRVQRRCEGRFEIEVGRPVLDAEHLDLYGRYQAAQHGDEGQSADPLSYRRFLIDTVTDTVEVTWRDKAGRLCGVSTLDVTPEALSSVYFYWEPSLARLSLGVYSALVEIELAKSWQRPYYYLGYLVPGSRTMSYKAGFPGAEVWDGAAWTPLCSRDAQDPEVQRILDEAEVGAMAVDSARFRLEAARRLQVLEDSDDEA